MTPAQTQRAFVKAKRRRLYDALVRQGLPEEKAMRIACTVRVERSPSAKKSS